MKLLIFIALLGVTLALPMKSFNGTKGRIVGGYTAEEGQFPYMASLRLPQNFHTCGGSILDEYWILTAAHCVYGNTQPIQVVVGTNHLQSGGVAYPATKILHHAEYDPTNIFNDVALIKVSDPIQFNSKVQPIQLAYSNDQGGSQAVLSGWGKLGTNTDVSESLQYQYFTTINPQNCAELLSPNPIYMSEICAFSQYGQGACQGDSGGPLVINGVQHGITSWVIPCAVGQPDVYTRVYSFTDWIQYVKQNN